MIPTGFIWDEKYLKHDVGEMKYNFKNSNVIEVGPEFEHPQRAIVIKEILAKTGVLEKMVPFSPYEAKTEDLLRVHSEEHIKWVMEACKKGIREIGPEAYGNSMSEEIARLSAGGAMKAVDICMEEEEINQAYALIRPPGHHATTDMAMGFCLYNNVAVAASYAIEKYHLTKVLILDWDVHHGNGTEEIFYERNNVLFISIHEDSYFPLNSGEINKIGSGEGEGFNINIPLPPLTGDEGYQRTFIEVIEPIVQQYEPDLILVSAGQDSNAFDPLARMMVLRPGFRYMGRKIRELAKQYANGKLAILQEGGYSIPYLPIATLGVIEGLMDIEIDWQDPHQIPKRALDPKVIKTIEKVKKVHAAHWEF